MIDLTDELKKAFREKNSNKKTIIGELKTRVKNLQIDSKKDEISENEFLAIVKSTIKMTKETIDEFAKVNRDEIVSEESEKLSYLEGLLPPQLTDEEVTKMVSDAIEQTSATSIKEMGQVMGLVQRAIKISGKDVDNSLVSKIIKDSLL